MVCALHFMNPATIDRDAPSTPESGPMTDRAILADLETMPDPPPETTFVSASATVVWKLANLNESVPVVITGAGAERPDRWEFRATRPARP